MFQSDHVCRVCLAEGAWNIFSTNIINDSRCTVASINCIRDKLQYVTELQLHEDDGLPIRICELCIVQLNIAYRFKRLATESDGRLRKTLPTREVSPSTQNAITNGEDAPVIETEPEIVMIKLEDLSDNITIEPTTVSEEHINPVSFRNEAITSNDPVKPDGMVYLQKDIFNPAEDAAYLEGIMKMEVISKASPIVDDTKTNQQTFSTSKITSAVQSEVKKKASKSRKKHKQRSEGARRPQGSENDKRKRNKSSKKRAKQSKESTKTSDQNQNNSGTGSTKMKTKLTEATLRKKRLQKVLNDLRIDMMYNTTVGRHSMMEQPIPNGTTNSPKMPMKRRNSICVSSFAPWL
uniref:ZAD domain-containing protein n=1 Tax=Anopheles minimus TaxID=112268 RepID=A0A182WI85_9DIPT